VRTHQLIVADFVILEPRVDVPVNCITLAARLPGNQSDRVPREVHQLGEVLFKSCLKLVGEFTSCRRISDYAEAGRREVSPPIEVESATWSAGGRSTGGSRKGESGWAGYGVPTAVNDGSALLIFAKRDRLASGNR